MNGKTQPVLAAQIAHRTALLGQRLWHDLKALGIVLVQWQARSRERRQLARMSERMLRDVGLSRADLEKEWRKPFWLE